MGNKITNEEFLKRFKKDGNPDYIPLENYKGMEVPIKWKCLKHNTEFFEKPKNMIRGNNKNTKCDKCKKELYKNKKIKPKTSKEILQQRFDKKYPKSKIIFLSEVTKYKENVICKCSKGHIWETNVERIMASGICPICNCTMLQEGVNDIATLRPDLAIYLKNPEDAKTYMPNYSGYLWIKCPYCGYEKEIDWWYFVNYGFNCPVCGDGTSFPNKIIRNLLLSIKESQNLSNVFFEYRIDKYYLDAYFEKDGKKYAVEMDGEEHSRTCWNRDYKEVQKRDKINNELAKQENIELIRIDCFRSNFEKIKKNIISSKLNNIINLENIDWNTINLKSRKSLIIEVCNYLENNKDKTIKEAGIVFNINRATVSKYLKIGREIGISSYSSNKYREKGIKVTCYDKEGKLVGEFVSVLSCKKFLEENYNYKIGANTIKKFLEGKPHKEYEFVFKKI